jgi:hypothetical protein
MGSPLESIITNGKNDVKEMKIEKISPQFFPMPARKTESARFGAR